MVSHEVAEVAQPTPPIESMPPASGDVDRRPAAAVPELTARDPMLNQKSMVEEQVKRVKAGQPLLSEFRVLLGPDHPFFSDNDVGVFARSMIKNVQREIRKLEPLAEVNFALSIERDGNTITAHYRNVGLAQDRPSGIALEFSQAASPAAIDTPVVNRPPQVFVDYYGMILNFKTTRGDKDNRPNIAQNVMRNFETLIQSECGDNASMECRMAASRLALIKTLSIGEDSSDEEIDLAYDARLKGELTYLLGLTPEADATDIMKAFAEWQEKRKNKHQ